MGSDAVMIHPQVEIIMDENGNLMDHRHAESGGTSGLSVSDP